MAKMNVKKGDNVMVIAGKDKGKAGKVLKVLPEDNRVYVEGINIVSKSKKPRNAQDKGGILKQEAAIDASNVMLICASCGQVVRARHAKEENANGELKKRDMKCCKAQAKFKVNFWVDALTLSKTLLEQKYGQLLKSGKARFCFLRLANQI